MLSSSVAVIALAWLGVAAHLLVGIATWRRMSTLPLLPLVNATTALCVLAYWAQRWYGYVVKGITWYATDQLVPLYALLVLLLAGVAPAGRYAGGWPQWVVFGVDAFVLLGAALFLSVFRIGRLL